MEADSSIGMVPDDPEHPRRVPVLRRRHLQARRRALGRRTHAAGRRADAAAAGQHAAARRTDQPPRPRLQGRPARGARGLRRHADLRLARPLLRRSARQQDRRRRRRAPSRSTPAPTSSSSGAGRSGPGPRPARPDSRRSSDDQTRTQRTQRPARRGEPSTPPNTQPGRALPPRRQRQAHLRGQEAGRRRRSTTSARGPETASRRIAELETLIAERERTIKDLEASMAGPGFYDDRSCRRIRSRPPSGPDVGSRRPDAAVGKPPGC